MIGEDGTAKVVTSGIQKRYNDISYSLDDEEEPAPKKPEPLKAKQPAKTKDEPKKSEKAPKADKGKKKKQSSEEEYSDEDDEDYDGESGSEGSQEIMKQGLSGNTQFTSSRLRSKAVNQKEKQDEMEERKVH